MIKAEILTDASVYQLNLVDFDDLDAAYEFVSRELAHPDAAEFKGADAILCIDLVDSKVKSYKVWREAQNPLDDHFGRVQPPEMTQPAELEPYEWHDIVLFLGRKSLVTCLAVNNGDRIYILPTGIDGKPPHEAVSPNNLAAIMDTVIQRNPAYSAVIPPPVMLTGAEAVAYLLDFVDGQESKPKNVERTAQSAGRIIYGE